MWDVGCWMADVRCWMSDVGLGIGEYYFDFIWISKKSCLLSFTVQL
jgi:hypothetical protein